MNENADLPVVTYSHPRLEHCLSRRDARVIADTFHKNIPDITAISFHVMAHANWIAYFADIRLKDGREVRPSFSIGRFASDDVVDGPVTIPARVADAIIDAREELGMGAGDAWENLLDPTELRDFFGEWLTQGCRDCAVSQ